MKKSILSEHKITHSAIFTFLTVLFIAAALFLFSDKLYAAETGAHSVPDFASEYETIYFDNYDGLVSFEINAIAQTPDGYIWVGTYSGLYRYDGYRFEKSNLDDRICNVMSLFVDSSGRLWIGTNDSGLCCYDPDSNETLFFTTDDGLDSDSIRSMCEDESGNIYIATIGAISVITLSDGSSHIETHTEWPDIVGVRSLAQYKGNLLAGVTNGGIFFLIKDGELLDTATSEDESVYYLSVSKGSADELLVGTSVSSMVQINIENLKIETVGQIDTGETAYINDIYYDAQSGGFFYCAENGLGFLPDGGDEVTDLSSDSFNSSVSGVISDYEGNIWFVSNKQGVIEFSRNPFMNVFARAGLDDSVVNAVTMRDNIIYFGTDSGLYAIDSDSYKQKHFDFLSKFEGVRIRHILTDSKGNLWISTYGTDGLVMVDANGNCTVYNESEAGTVGGRFRYCLEASDGTIYAASNMGINLRLTNQTVRPHRYSPW